MTVVVIGVDEVRELLQTFPEHLYDKTRKQITKSFLEMKTKIVRPLKTGTHGLQSRTGNLARSIHIQTGGSVLNNLFATLFTNSIYAPIHEEGGTIYAKNAYVNLPGGPFLNIPSSQNKTAAGIMRKTAATVFAQGAYIRKINAPRAQYMVILDGVPMFWLVKSVSIKARLHMVKTAEDEIPTLLSSLNAVLLDGL